MSTQKMVREIWMLSCLALFLLISVGSQEQVEFIEGAKITGIIPGSVAEKLKLQKGDVIVAFAKLEIANKNDVFQAKIYIQYLEKCWRESGEKESFWLEQQVDSKQEKGISVQPTSFSQENEPFYELKIIRDGKFLAFEVNSASWGAYIEDWDISKGKDWQAPLAEAINSKDEKKCLEIIEKHQDQMSDYFLLLEKMLFLSDEKTRKKALSEAFQIAKYYEKIAAAKKISSWNFKQSKFWQKMIEEMAGWEENEIQLYQEAREYFDKGISEYNKEEFLTAVKLFEKSLKLSNSLSSKLQLSDYSLNNAGNIYAMLGKYEKALKYQNESLGIRKELGSLLDIADSLNNIGNIYESLSQYEDALEYHNQSLSISQELGNHLGIARSLNGLGNIYKRRNKYKKALEYYNQSLSINRKLGHHLEVGACLNNISNIYEDLGEYKKALSHQKQSLAISQKFGSRSGISDSLKNIANIYQLLGEYEKALSHYSQSLSIKQELNDLLGVGSSLSSIGNIYLKLSKYEKALEYHNESLAMKKNLGDQIGIANSLESLGVLYQDLGEYEKALEYHNESLTIREMLRDQVGISNCLSNIGIIYAMLEEYGKALGYHNRAYSIRKRLGNPFETASSLHNLGAIYKNLNQYEKALVYYKRSISINEDLGLEHSLGIAQSLRNMGSVYETLGKHQKALELHNKSITIQKELGDYGGVASSLFSRAHCYRSLGKKKKASSDYKVGLSHWYEISKVAKIARKSFMEKRVFHFQEGIDFLISQEEKKEAWEIFQKYKGYGFLSLMAESKANLEETIDPKLKGKRNLVLAQISDIQKKLRTAGTQNKSIQNQLEEKEYELRKVIGEIRRVNSAFSKLVYPQAVSLKQVQSDLKEGEVLLEYFFTAKKENTSGKAYCFIIDKNSLETIELGNSAEINKKLKSFIYTLKDTKNISMTWIYKEEATELYQLLLHPVLQDRKISRLIVAPDEMLHRLPFSSLCLPVEEEGESWQELSYVADKYDISYVTSATTMVEMNKETKRKEKVKEFSLLAMADPIGGGQANTRQKLSSLPGARKEVLAIAKNILDKTSLLEISEDFTIQNKNISISFGKEAQEAKLFLSSLSQYNIFHFATHGVIDPENSLRSFLVLAPTKIDKTLSPKSILPLESISDGNLQAREIFHLKNKIQAKLVVLSACETGLGKLETGDGVVGFARAWMYTGVDSLIVSLWKVEDISTSLLMENFYQHLFSKGNSKHFLKYLTQAKKQLRYSQNYAAPYYWAPFVFIGK